MRWKPKCGCTIACSPFPIRSGGTDFLAQLNPKSIDLRRAKIEPGLQSANPEERFQFERHGYFVADVRDSVPGKPVFNRAVTLRDSWGKGKSPRD